MNEIDEHSGVLGDSMPFKVRMAFSTLLDDIVDNDNADTFGRAIGVGRQDRSRSSRIPHFARDNQWRTASRTASFINDLSIFVGEVDNMVDHARPSLVFLRCLQVDVQSGRKIGQNATEYLKPVSLRQIRLRNTMKNRHRSVSCIASSVTSEENDIFGIEASQSAGQSHNSEEINHRLFALIYTLFLSGAAA